MPIFNVILNLPGFSIKKVSGSQSVLLDVNYNRIPGIAKHQRSTERLQAQVFHQHTYGVSQKTHHALLFSKSMNTSLAENKDSLQLSATLENIKSTTSLKDGVSLI